MTETVRLPRIRRAPRRTEPLRDVAAAARAHGALAIGALASIADDPKAPPAARVAAAGKLLERGYGRASAELGEDELAGMSDAELDRMLRRHLGGDDV